MERTRGRPRTASISVLGSDGSTIEGLDITDFAVDGIVVTIDWEHDHRQRTGTDDDSASVSEHPTRPASSSTRPATRSVARALGRGTRWASTRCTALELSNSAVEQRLFMGNFIGTDAAGDPGLGNNLNDGVY